MKTKLLAICLLLVTSQVFAKESNIIHKGSEVDGKRNGLFFDTTSSEIVANYYSLGIYKDNTRVGLWMECSRGPLSGDMLTIGFYDDKGVKKGIWWGWDSCNKKVVEDFFNLKKISCSLADDIKYWNLFKLVVDGNFDIHFLEFFQNGNPVDINPTLNGKPIDGREWEGFYRLGVEDMCKELINTEYIRPWKKDNALYKDWLVRTQELEKI